MTNAPLALITGANKGIGFEAARQLAALGIRVLIGSRDSKRGQEAVIALKQQGIVAQALAIDVTDAVSIKAAAQIVQEFGQLDILVNNAGIGLDRFVPSEVDIAHVREVMDTNLFGAIATTQAFMPLLRKSAAARIVNVSSMMGSLFHLADPQWVGHQMLYTSYSISKAALNAFTAVLSAELLGSPIKVNSVEPGYTATDMTKGNGFQTVEQAAKVIVKYATIDDAGPSGGYFDINGRIAW
jgi:NAD(P)-dependent dehydrogenase (short-subunit alcohol dehydrogenase family)